MEDEWAAPGPVLVLLCVTDYTLSGRCSVSVPSPPQLTVRRGRTRQLQTCGLEQPTGLRLVALTPRQTPPPGLQSAQPPPHRSPRTVASLEPALATRPFGWPPDFGLLWPARRSSQQGAARCPSRKEDPWGKAAATSETGSSGPPLPTHRTDTSLAQRSRAFCQPQSWWQRSPPTLGTVLGNGEVEERGRQPTQAPAVRTWSQRV